MTDQDKSETPASGGSDAAANPQAGTPAQFGAFGSARGSGLARGKRTGSAAAPTPAKNEGEYKPTAVEVIIPRLEYKNPFDESAPAAVPSPEIPAQPEPAPAPAIVHHAPAPARAPEPVPAPAAAQAEVEAELAPATPRPVFQAPPREMAEPAEHFPFDGPAQAPARAPSPAPVDPARSELKILPPAESKRAPTHWDNSPERRSESYPPRQPRDDRRERRPEHRSDAPRGRDNRHSSAPSSSERKPGGFLAWLKGLFSPAKPAAPVPSERESDSGFDRDREHSHGGHRRRRRGGRGRNRSEHGGESGRHAGGGHAHPSGDQPQGGGEHRGGHSEGGDREGGGRSGDREGGQHRRRHRGGRNRHRDDRGPRPEGQQGGGFI